MKDKVKFMEYMTLFGEIHKTEVTDVIKNAYWKTLKPYTDQECIRVFEAIYSELKWFPKPPDFLERLRGDKKDQGILAWEKVYKTITGVGHYNSVKFDDPIIHSCIELMGGWVQLCEITNSEVKWKQKEFLELYLTMSKKNPEQHPKYLPGTIEINNGARGYKVPDVIMVGDKKKIKELNEGSNKP